MQVSLIILILILVLLISLWLHEISQHAGTRRRMNSENYKWQGESDKWYTCFQAANDENRRLVDKILETKKDES